MENGQLSLESLLTGPNLIAAGMLLIVVLLLVIIVRSRGNATQRNKNWELQEATWGIQGKRWLGCFNATSSTVTRNACTAAGNDRTAR